MKVTLKAARVAAGYKQAEAAKRLGCNTGTLASYEAGKTFPDVMMLKKIEILYGVSYNDIIFVCDEITR